MHLKVHITQIGNSLERRQSQSASSKLSEYFFGLTTYFVNNLGADWPRLMLMLTWRPLNQGLLCTWSQPNGSKRILDNKRWTCQ